MKDALRSSHGAAPECGTIKTGLITWPMNNTKSPKRRNIVPGLVSRGFAINQQLMILNEEFKKSKSA